MSCNFCFTSFQSTWDEGVVRRPSVVVSFSHLRTEFAETWQEATAISSNVATNPNVVEFEFIGVLRHMQRYFSHICDATDVQADWRRICTYGRAPNAIGIS